MRDERIHAEMPCKWRERWFLLVKLQGQMWRASEVLADDDDALSFAARTYLTGTYCMTSMTEKMGNRC